MRNSSTPSRCLESWNTLSKTVDWQLTTIITYDYQNKRTYMHRHIHFILRRVDHKKKNKRIRKTIFCICTGNMKKCRLPSIPIIYYDIVISIIIFHPRRNEFGHFKNSLSNRIRFMYLLYIIYTYYIYNIYV